MEGFDFSGSPNTNNEQFSFDSQPLQSFDFGENTTQNALNPGDYLASLSPSDNQFSEGSPISFSTDPNDFINNSSPSFLESDNASFSNLNDSVEPSGGNFSVDPSDFIPPTEQNQSIAVDSFSYPPPIETPLENFVAEPSPIQDSFFNESPKTPEEPKSVSVYSSLSDNDNSSKIVEKNQILREYEFEHEKFLQERANEERQKHEEVVAQAQNELKKFYAEREERTKKLKEENNANSSSLGSNIPSDDKEAWVNLDNLLDWKSVSRDSKEDTSRMRSILITLKH